MHSTEAHKSECHVIDSECEQSDHQVHWIGDPKLIDFKFHRQVLVTITRSSTYQACGAITNKICQLKKKNAYRDNFVLIDLSLIV